MNTHERNGCTSKWVDSIRDLGVLVDSSVKFQHISLIVHGEEMDEALSFLKFFPFSRVICLC
jgi:hypothetical protein